MFAYLDDFLLCAPSREEAERDTWRLVVRLHSLGFSIDHTKSVLSPTQNIEYLGLKINSVSFRVFCGEISPTPGFIAAGKFSVIMVLSPAVRSDSIINICPSMWTAENEGY